MQNLTVYQRYENARPGELHRNSTAPDVPLHALDGSTLRLRDLHAKLNAGLARPLPLLILAGSVS